MMPIYGKGQKEDLGKNRPVSLMLVPEKVMEQIILSMITWHVQDCTAERRVQEAGQWGIRQKGDHIELPGIKYTSNLSERVITSSPSYSKKYLKKWDGSTRHTDKLYALYEVEKRD